MSNRKYKNPPLREVVFEVLIDNSRLLEIDEIEIFLHEKGFDKTFPEKQKRFIFEGKIEINNNEPSSDSKNYHDGFICWTNDKKKAIIIRPNSLGFVFLKPYLGWNESFKEFACYIDTAVEFFNIKSLTRLAIRSINQIDFNNELKAEDFNLHINHKFENLNSIIQSCVNQKLININSPIPNLKANIIEALNFDDFNPTLKKFILDIDVFSENTFSVDNKKTNDIFNEIRNTKNSIFESYLKSNSREYFDK